MIHPDSKAVPLYVLKHTGSLLFAALLCATASVLAAAPEQECGESVPLAKLIANPNAYHGKALWVVVYATIEFEKRLTIGESTMKLHHGNQWG